MTVSRVDIEEKWTAIIEGRLTREEVHAWAHPIMLGDDPSDDLMVMSAIQYLDGFDLVNDPESGELLRHGAPGDYLRSTAEVAQELQRWRANCVAYDADPVGWSQRARETARRRIDEQRRGGPDAR